MKTKRRPLSEQTKREMRAGATSLFRNNREALLDARRGPQWAKWRDRENWIAQQIKKGTLRLVPQLRADGIPLSNPGHVEIAVGLCTFFDTVKSFPSTKLVAQVALAIQAGQHEQTSAADADIENEARDVIAGQQLGAVR